MLAPLFFALQSANVHAYKHKIEYLFTMFDIFMAETYTQRVIGWGLFLSFSRLDRHVYYLCLGEVIIIIINSARQMFGFKIINNC